MIKKQASLLDFFKKPSASTSNPSSQETTSSKAATPNNKKSTVKNSTGSSKKNDNQLSSTQTKKVKISSVSKASPFVQKSLTELSTQATTDSPSQDVRMSNDFMTQKENLKKSLDSKLLADEKKGEKVPRKPAKKSIASNTPVKAEQDMLIDIEKNEKKAFDYNDFTDRTPYWALKENTRDANKRRPSEPGYDPTTLYIPPDELKKCTPTMKQFWQIKSENYDKLILFKLGKFYELFYDDALICHQELDLNWMATRMHVGFPEKALEHFACLLINKGYKVCIVEHTETVKQMEERLVKQPAISRGEKSIKREMVQVMSKGTYIDPNDLNHEPRILLSIRQRRSLISVAFLDIGFHKISIGCFQDDENYTNFKTFISQLRPTEVVYEALEVDARLLRTLRNCSSQPVFSPLNDPRAWNSIQAYSKLEEHNGVPAEWPENLRELTETDELKRDQMFICFSGMISYLTKMLIVDDVLSTARYEVYDPKTFSQSRMVLDSQALQHLEILEIEYATRSRFEGSLLSYIDRAASKFGKRLLRKWICAPLLNIKAINSRLDAVEDLEGVYEHRNKFMTQLGALPDLERGCGRIYKLSIRKNEHVIMFDDISTAKLKEFRKLMENLKKARDVVLIFKNNDFKSELLRSLTTFVNADQIKSGESFDMPEILPLIDEISNFVVWGGPQQDRPGPKPGVDSEYDIAQNEIAAIEAELDDYLKEIRAKFGNSKEVCYAHSKKRYEIELPAKMVAGNKKPSDFEFSSRKQDKERFITKKTTELVERLEEVEERKKQILSVFVCFMFNYFYKHHKVWDRFIEGLAQLDCLCSLSKTSFVSEGNICRPELYPPDERVFLEVKNMKHPCISAIKSNFIANDIIIGEVEEEYNIEGSPHIMLLTGPNMGGKSTALRQACIAAILAQIGCYIPASSCKLSVVDRIFTRIGASDKLSEGKSTFYIEMEETLNVLKYGTRNSLSIMDELGRGTSTYDGLAIACSVLNYISDKLRCRTLFATHYHILLDEFRDNRNVKFYHMAAKTDTEHERIIFLYKLIEGECSNSFGLNIAKISGLPEEALKVARKKAIDFEKEFSLRENVQTTKALEKILKAVGETSRKEIDVEDCFERLQSVLEGYLKI